MSITQNLILNNDFNNVKDNYSELKLDQEEIEGFLTIEIEKQKFRYWILIKANDYPNKLPKLYLKNFEHIKGINRHIYEDRECCVGVGELEIFSKFTDFKINIKEYIEHLVIPYLFSQSYYDYYGEWPFGEYSHGVEGTKEKLVEIFEVNNFKEVISLSKRTMNKKIGRNRKCPCRSGKKYKDCHEKVINKISSWNMSAFIEPYIKKIKNLKENSL